MSGSRFKASDLVQDKKFGFSISGLQQEDLLGQSVASVGDFNGDGYDDVIVGSSAGEAYILYGKNGLNSIDLNSLNGENGFIVRGTGQDKLGYSVSSAGDFNDDGFNDIVVGAYEATPPGFRGLAGKAYILYGNTSFSSPFDVNTLSGTNGVIINGISQRDNTGFSVASAGDFNGDGISDVVIGAYRADTNNADAGKAFVVYGAKNHSSTLELKDMNSNEVGVIQGLYTSDKLGTSVSSAGDFNGDGIDDIIIGSQGFGESCVVYGSANFRTISIGDLDGKNGIIIDEMTSRSNDFGYSVSSAGDFNGDNISDVIVGAPKSQDGYHSQGDAYIIYGKTNYTKELETNSYGQKILNVSPSFQTGDAVYRNYSLLLRGDQSEGGQFGYSVSQVGDINGDGYDDVLIGARAGNQDGSDGESWTGLVYLLYGSSEYAGFIKAADWSSNLGFIIEGTDPKGYLGWSLSSAGDFNGDGYGDIIIGAPYSWADGIFAAGKVYVIYGDKIFNELVTNTDITTVYSKTGTTHTDTTTAYPGTGSADTDDRPKEDTEAPELTTTAHTTADTTPHTKTLTVEPDSAVFESSSLGVILLGLSFALLD